MCAVVERDVILHRLYHIVTKKQFRQKEQAGELRPFGAHRRFKVVRVKDEENAQG